MADDQWWYNLNTKTVEQDAQRDKAANRLGPYGSREEAEQALQKVDERNEDYDNDPKWNDR